jgi:predicted RNA-binding Zn-ribbon protein involved in translation (DUF1610 family)
MDLDPNTVAQGATAFKTIFDGLRSAIGMLRDLRETEGSGSAEQKKLVDQALDRAEQATKVAEAQVAQALGYELCKCKFPPTIMLTVGYAHNARHKGTVYECPKCGHDTAGGAGYRRTAPPRDNPSTPVVA